jgi:hypothetical protein
MRFWLTLVLLLLLLYLASKRGGQPEIWAAVAYGTSCHFIPAARIFAGQPTFLEFDPLLFFVDSAVLAALVAVALRANRLWPLCASALQLLVVTAHLAKLMRIEGMSGVYWGMTTLPMYLGYLVLALGILKSVQRAKESVEYPDWRDE